MKKTLLFLILVFAAVVTGCTNVKEEPKFDSYSFFNQHPEYLQNVVIVENNKAPLNVQHYNKMKNNVVNIEFIELVLTHGTGGFCKGYFKTIWTIKSEYFSEEEYEYLIPCPMIKHNPKTENTTWEVEWPLEHPFLDK